MKRKTEQNRQNLLKMAKGQEDRLLLCSVLYSCCVMPLEDIEAAGKKAENYLNGEKCCIMPAAPSAAQDIYATLGNATTPGKPWNTFLASICETEEDIAAALEQRPCLVNYGGTLYAVNTGKTGQPCIIPQDRGKAPKALKL